MRPVEESCHSLLVKNGLTTYDRQVMHVFKLCVIFCLDHEMSGSCSGKDTAEQQREKHL